MSRVITTEQNLKETIIALSKNLELTFIQQGVLENLRLCGNLDISEINKDLKRLNAKALASATRSWIQKGHYEIYGNVTFSGTVNFTGTLVLPYATTTEVDNKLKQFNGVISSTLNNGNLNISLNDTANGNSYAVYVVQPDQDYNIVANDIDELAEGTVRNITIINASINGNSENYIIKVAVSYTYGESYPSILNTYINNEYVNYANGTSFYEQKISFVKLNNQLQVWSTIIYHTFQD